MNLKSRSENSLGPHSGALSLAFALALVINLVACGEKDEEQPVGKAQAAAVPIPSAALLRTEIRSVNPAFSMPGVIEAKQSASINPQITARVKAIHFVAGDTVKVDDLLVELDATEYEVALAGARAERESAKASLTRAANQWGRAKELIPDGYISQSDYDAAKAAVETARAVVSHSEAALQQAELDITYTQIKAPFSGKVSKPFQALGNLVSPNSSIPLFELVQLDPIYAVAGIELSVYNRFQMLRHKLNAGGIEVPELTLSLELVGGQEYPQPGTFVGWDHESVGAVGTISGRAEFPNPIGLLLPEQTVVLHGRALEPVERVFVPQKAVMQDQQGHYVFTVDNSNTVRRNNIEVGIRDGAEWAVRSGLEAGKLLVVEGAGRLAPGTQASLGN